MRAADALLLAKTDPFPPSVSRMRSPEVKDLRVRLHIAENDYAIKLKAARRMLDKGSSVRFAVQVRRDELQGCALEASQQSRFS